jgi:hypothetical protein
MTTFYMTSKELSARWEKHISVKTLANWRCDGKGPRFRRYGNKILYSLEEVEAYEQANVLSSTRRDWRSTEDDTWPAMHGRCRLCGSFRAPAPHDRTKEVDDGQIPGENRLPLRATRRSARFVRAQKRRRR